MLKRKLLAMALSIPILCSTCFISNLNVFAADDSESIVENSIDVESSITTINNENNRSENVSNFPDENGDLRFWMDDLEDRLSTLTLTYKAEDNNKAISGAQVTIYKIADLSVSYGDAKYTLIEELSSDYPNINFDGMSSEEIDKIAEEMSNKHLKEAAEVTTDDKGICKFTDLEPGLYLIKEKAKIGAAKDYEYFKSFIINVPFPKTEEGVYDGHWIYDVEALPKTRIPTKKKLIIIPPQTGDNTNYTYLYFFGGLLAVSVVETVAIIILLKKRNKKNNS